MSTREKTESTENELLLEKIRVGVSSCLLGQEVRFDGGHKRDNYLTGTLSCYFEFIPYCPEAEVGLGVPRQPIRLVRRGEEIRAVGVKTPELDPTDQLAAFAERTASQLGEISGYILKKDSPSCGMERVKIYNDKGMPERKGVGIYAGVLMQRLPLLPVEEEGRLGDAVLRENFIERVFVYHRWQRLVREGLTAKRLIEFHSDHKFLILSHHQKAYRELGRLVANAGKSDLDKLAGEYIAMLMKALKRPARPSHGLFGLATGLRQGGGESRQADSLPDPGRRHAGGAQAAQRGRRCRLRQLAPGGIPDQAVMPVGRRRQAEQSLQQPMHRRGVEQILSPHHMGDALQGIVQHHREVIAGRRILAREDDVAPCRRIRRDGTALALGARTLLGPVEHAGTRDRRRHVEPQRVRRARCR